MSRVWEHSRHGGTELLMLLAIADFSDDDGHAYPAVGTLATKCRMKLRNAQAIIAALRRSGELEVRENEGPKGTNRYRIALVDHGVQRTAGVQNTAGVQSTARRGAVHCAKPLQPTAPEPSVNRQEPERGVRAARAPAADRGTRLAADWSLPAEWRAWAVAQRPDLEVDDTAARFSDHWRAQPGAKGRKSDWLATWRNWVRNERRQPGQTHRQAVLHADDTFGAES